MEGRGSDAAAGSGDTIVLEDPRADLPEPAPKSNEADLTLVSEPVMVTSSMGMVIHLGVGDSGNTQNDPSVDNVEEQRKELEMFGASGCSRVWGGTKEKGRMRGELSMDPLLWEIVIVHDQTCVHSDGNEAVTAAPVVESRRTPAASLGMHKSTVICFSRV